MSQMARIEWDDTARTVVTYDASGTPTGSRPYTSDENAGADRRAADVRAGANDVDLRTKANNALTVNANFLAIATPTNADIVLQVQRLTRECSALIRELLRALDTVSGT